MTSSAPYTGDSSAGSTGATALTVEQLPEHDHGSKSLVGSGRLRSVNITAGDTFMSASGIISTSVEAWSGSHAGIQAVNGVSQDQAFTVNATHTHNKVGAGWGHSHTMSHNHYADHYHGLASHVHSVPAHAHTMAHTHTVATMPPYTVAYCWRRIA